MIEYIEVIARIPDYIYTLKLETPTFEVSTYFLPICTLLTLALHSAFCLLPPLHLIVKMPKKGKGSGLGRLSKQDIKET